MDDKPWDQASSLLYWVAKLYHVSNRSPKGYPSASQERDIFQAGCCSYHPTTSFAKSFKKFMTVMPTSMHRCFVMLKLLDRRSRWIWMAPRHCEFCVTASRIQSTLWLVKGQSRYLSDDKNVFNNRWKCTDSNKINSSKIHAYALSKQPLFIRWSWLSGCIVGLCDGMA